MIVSSSRARPLVLAAMSLVAILPNAALANDIICIPPAFHVEGFESVVEARLGGLKGYSVTIARPGEIVASHSGGVAVDGVDTPVPVPVDGSTPANVGSTVKMVSAIALLQFFENDTSATVEEWLDREIVDYFPVNWQDRVFDPSAPDAIQDIRFVTFRDILQHRSGLAEPSVFIENGIDYDDLVANEFEYSNGNISVIGYMWPYIVQPDLGVWIDAAVVNEPPVENHPLRGYTAPFFGDWMQTHIFDDIDVSVAPGVDVPYGLWSSRLEPSCDHKQTYAVTPYFRNLAWGTSGDKPLVGDMDGDGEDDLVVWRPSTAQWFARRVDESTITNGLVYGLSGAGDVPLVGDVDGDGADDYVIWRASTGGWYARASDGDTLATDVRYGASGDIPLVGNVGGNAAEDFVVWRPSTGAWYAKQRNGTTLFSGVVFGRSGDVPHVGDVNRDGVADLVIWRPSTGEWFARNPVNNATLASGVSWGVAGDISLLGDAEGNGDEEFMIFRPSTGEWFARDTNGVYFREAEWGRANVTGSGSLVPLVGDFGGDFKDKLTLFDPTNGRWSAAGRRYSLAYDNAADDGPGTPLPFVVESGGCSSQGGYWFSSMEYAAWAAALGAGEIISLELLESLYDPASPDDAIAWSSDVPAPAFIQTNYGLTRMPSHGGVDPWGHRSSFIQLPAGYYGFAWTNDIAVPGSTGTLRSAMIDAWIEAVDLDCEGG